MNNPPLEVAFWIADYLQSQRELSKLNTYQLTSCLNSLDSLVDALGGCERVLKTPIPLAYSIHLKPTAAAVLPGPAVSQWWGALGWANLPSWLP